MTESRKTLENPRRLAYLLRWDKLVALVRSWNAPREWKTQNDGLRYRHYDSYRAYIRHQKSKLPLKDLRTYDLAFRKALAQRLESHGLVAPGSSVLCLGARIGTEVKAFGDRGCFAVGIDLNPGKNNEYVVVGDFHDLRFPDASADVIFTNSLDHSLNIEQVLAEVRRVLKPDGLLIVEAATALETPGLFEAAHWSSINDLLELLHRHSWHTAARSRFDVPWEGEHLCLRPR